MADRLRMDVPFPAAGEGTTLRFSNVDVAELQKRFGPTWFTGSFERLNNFDIEFFRACVEIGARRDGKKIKIVFEELDLPLMTIGETVLDALYVCVHGMTFNEFLIDQAVKADALEPKANPTNVSSQENTSLS